MYNEKFFNKLIHSARDKRAKSGIDDQMALGVEYYEAENREILNRKMLIYTETEDGIPIEMEDPYKANNKLTSPFMRILVDQKVNYSLGKDISVSADNPDLFWDELGDDFQEKLKDVGMDASKKGKGWMHIYIDKMGRFGTKVIPSEQCTPIYENGDEDSLKFMIRRYIVELVTMEGDFEDWDIVEVWTKENVYVYRHVEGKYHFLKDEDVFFLTEGDIGENPRSHIVKIEKYGTTVAAKSGMSWGAVPFVKLQNNSSETSDLKPIKNYVDAYDKTFSDFSNNLEDFQDVYWVLKGYGGQNLNDFLHQVKRYKTLKIGEGGDAKAETIDIPHEARSKILISLEDDIYAAGRGFDPSKISSGGSNITNVMIRSKFAALDIKANDFESRLFKFLSNICWFVDKWQELRGTGQILGLQNIRFNRSIIVNEVELLDANTRQRGSISEELRLSNHVWVDDMEQEVERLKEQMPDPFTFDYGQEQEEDE